MVHIQQMVYKNLFVIDICPTAFDKEDLSRLHQTPRAVPYVEPDQQRSCILTHWFAKINLFHTPRVSARILEDCV